MSLDTSRRWVTRCALSRICGVCGESLGRPIAIPGTHEEEGRNAFHAPPMHPDCAQELLVGDEFDLVVRTSGFDFERPGPTDLDQRVRLVPNSLVD